MKRRWASEWNASKYLQIAFSWRFKHRVQITYKCFICCSVLETEEQGQPDPIQPVRRYRIILFQRPRASISLAKMVEERDTLIFRIACSEWINERGGGGGGGGEQEQKERPHLHNQINK